MYGKLSALIRVQNQSCSCINVVSESDFVRSLLNFNFQVINYNLPSWPDLKGGHYFQTWCPSVRHKKTRYNVTLGLVGHFLKSPDMLFI